MEFKIFLRKKGHLVRLMKFSRTEKGLYIFSGRSSGDDYDTYHEDGKTWFRRKGDIKVLKKIKQPLFNFKGAETISRGIYSIYEPMPNDPIELNTTIKSEDIVFDRQGSDFFIEVILSEKKLTLEKLPDRINSQIFIKDQIFPIVTVEIFDKIDRIVPEGRYPDSIEYTEGTNLFFEDSGRI